MRVRFAPSPTGALHIGGARTALYNWLLARGPGDGPQGAPERSSCASKIPTASARRRRTSSRSSMRCAGWGWTGTRARSSRPSGPSATARRWSSCSRSGHAYHSSATADDVTAFKDRARRRARLPRRARGRPGRFACGSPTTARRSSTTSSAGRPGFPNANMDDPVIARADGSALYNFAVAIDDLDAGITHVVRGEDHLSNTPKQLLVLQALGADPRATPTCRCCTVPTAASSQSATAPPPCRSCATPATCLRRSTTTSPCSGPASPPTRSTSPSASWPSASAWTGCPRTRPSSTSASCATSTAAICVSWRWTSSPAGWRSSPGATGLRRRGGHLAGEDPDPG